MRPFFPHMDDTDESRMLPCSFLIPYQAWAVSIRRGDNKTRKMWTHDLILQILDSLHTGSISLTSSPYQTNDHMNKAKHKAMNCETNMCTHTSCWNLIMLLLLCVTTSDSPGKGVPLLSCTLHQVFLYTIPLKPIPLLQSPFSPWLCCPTDHAVPLSLANTSLITRLIIFFSCSYFCCLHSQ